MNTIYHNSALEALKMTADESVDLIYVDPPFGTGNEQLLQRKKGNEVISKISYPDVFEDYSAFITAHVKELHRVLKKTGTMYLHLDWRNSHIARISSDAVFGPDNFLNEVIWAYDFGGRGKDRWPRKHDNILVYAKQSGNHFFNWDDIDRVPYSAPDMQRVGRSKEEAEKRIAAGKVPTDVWFMSIVGTNAKERNGYPTQKPCKLIERAIRASSPPGGLVMDIFAGSGTTGEAAHKHGRKFILADMNPLAIEVMKERFKYIDVTWKE